MKAYVEVDVFLTSALVGCEWSAPRPGRFTPPPGERAPDTHWIGGCVNPRAGMVDGRYNYEILQN
jgi:hypothetical protein